MKPRDHPRLLGLGAGVAFVLKALLIGLLIAAPLAGVWLASSLAAFANEATWLPVAAGLFLFPGLPLAWEWIASYRAKRDAGANRRWLTFTDRLVLRTLAINIAFLGVLLAVFPSRAFIALSARGDWMLDGQHGPIAERARRTLIASAGAMEWLHRMTSHNTYRERRDATDDAEPTPAPSTSPSLEPETEPHPVIRSMPPEAEASIETVGRYIAARETDPMRRVKALHDWVVDRIAYDAPNYVADRVPAEDRDAHEVFRSRVGVCAGYAKLLAALGKVTGDEIVYVVGDARSQDAPMTGVSHAWNAAKINGAWYLIDATWNAGSVEGSEFKKGYRTEYLFTPPERFVVSHFPDESKWQLLATPLSRAEFFRRPVLAPTFFAHGLVLKSPDRSQVSVTGSLDIAVDNPNGTFLLASFEAHDKNAGGPKDCPGDGHTQLHCVFPGPGTYDVRLFAHRTESGNYPFAGSVQVNVRP